MKSAILAAAAGLLLVHPAAAVTLDELKGYSIEANVVVNNVWKQSQGRDDPIANDVKAAVKIYISLAGHIFEYTDRSVGGTVMERERVVAAPDAAASAPRQRMIAWTVEGGNLTGISHEVEGFVVRTIAVDPARMTCTVTAVPRPDPATARVVMQKLNGYKAELASMTVRSAECAVRRGNIFSTEQ